MTDTRERHEAAYSVTGKRTSPLGWLPWVGLLLLLLLAASIFLIVRNVGDDGDDAGLDVSDDPAAAGQDVAGADTGDDLGAAGGAVPGAAGAPAATVETGAAAGAAPVPTTPAAAQPAPPNDAAGGATPAAAPLTAGGQAILPLPAAGLASSVGQSVVGTGVTVESVVADEGFWVGSSATDRVFVFLTPEARSTQGESPFQVEAGQRINLQGTLVALPGTPDSLGVDADQGAAQLTEQGHLVEATAISLS